MDKFEIVQTECGSVKGVHKLSALDDDYVSFQGIPYMKAPVGKLRFREAQPVEKWNDIFDATGDAPSFCSLNFITFECEGQEDAGTVNIFTKNLNPNKLLPVMIWIHGGGFQLGNSRTEMYGPDYLLQGDVIVVSINYRLGAIGFLSLEDESLGVPGNAGLKDQLLAIKWIKQNIRNFGGDPENITIFGESAGGASVHFLCLSEHSKGLFQRGIAMSGTAFCKQWGMIPRSRCRTIVENLGRKLGWKGNLGDEKNLLEFLEEVPAYDIINASKNVLSKEDFFVNQMMFPFTPVIEPYLSKNCMIPKDPVEMAKTSWSNEIDILFTGTSFEGIIRGIVNVKAAVAYLNKNPACFVPLLDLNLKSTDPIARELGIRLKNLYFPTGIESPEENREAYLRFSSEFLFWHAIYRGILSRIKHAKGSTYLLRFDVNGELNFVKQMNNCKQYKGAAHADDLFHLFKTIVADVPDKDSKEFKVIDRMVDIFTSFAKDGNPNADKIESIRFTPLNDSNSLRCVQINENGVSEILLPELEKLKVWDSVYEDRRLSISAKL